MKYTPNCGWTAKYKDNWKEAYERTMAWWNFEETDRPVVFTPVLKEDMPAGQKLTAAEKEKRDLDALAHMDIARRYNENRVFTAESVPFARTNFASVLGILAVCAGGSVEYSEESYTAWVKAEPNLYKRPLPVFDKACPPYDFAIKMIGKYHNAFGKDIVLGANPMLDPATTLALMRGVENFCMDLYEDPETVKIWLQRLGKIFLDITSGYREARASFGRREDINWTGAWAPGDMDAVQCDVSAYLSPEMFREFALEEAEREAAFFDYAIWHLDGTGEFKHLPDICAIKGINIIQWIDEKARSPLEYTHIWENILKTGRGLLMQTDIETAIELTKRLGKRGLAFTLSGIKTQKEMETALQDLREATNGRNL